MLLGNECLAEVRLRLTVRLAHSASFTDVDRALFAGTANFELVLGILSVAIRTCEVVGIDPAPSYATEASSLPSATRFERSISRGHKFHR